MKTTKRAGGLFAVFLLLFVGVLIWFFTLAEEYYTFMAGNLEGAVRVAPLNKEDMLARMTTAKPDYDTEVKYRKFFITAPGAEQVELRGDFNRWGKDPILLTSYNKGYFETSVALASGEYKYTFVVDGKETPDPTNQDRQKLDDGREICIKTVR
ncbi:MAG: glycogen-binding domain-containing protein [Elusimicrobiaceae bacterium]|nr:glycogen-binding domain-containing protein [Elusimicrobiaceae bacterium]